MDTVLLDVDGTLVDSNDAHAESWALAFRAYGTDVEVDRVRPLIGKGGDKLVREIAGVDIESELGEALTDYRSKVFMRSWLPKIRPFPHTRDLVVRLREDGFRIGVATSAGREEAEALLHIADVSDLVDAVSNGDDAKVSKPDPDILLATLDKLRSEPRTSFLIGDTPYDAEAARRSSVAFVGFQSGGWGPRDLRPSIAVYRNASELLSSYDQFIQKLEKR